MAAAQVWLGVHLPTLEISGLLWCASTEQLLVGRLGTTGSKVQGPTKPPSYAHPSSATLPGSLAYSFATTGLLDAVLLVAACLARTHDRCMPIIETPESGNGGPPETKDLQRVLGLSRQPRELTHRRRRDHTGSASR